MAQVLYNREILVEVLIYHWPTNMNGCHCGWSELGKSFTAHVADVYEGSVTARYVTLKEGNDGVGKYLQDTQRLYPWMLRIVNRVLRQSRRNWKSGKKRVVNNLCKCEHSKSLHQVGFCAGFNGRKLAPCLCSQFREAPDDEFALWILNWRVTHGVDATSEGRDTSSR